MPHFFFGGVILAKPQVGSHRAVEEQGFLRDYTQMFPKLRLGQIPDVYTVKQDFPAADLINPGDQVYQCGFTGASGADDGGGFAGVRFKADVLQHRAVGLGIVEGYIPELQRGKSADVVLVGAVVLNGGRVVQDCVDTGDRSHGPGNHVHHHGGGHDAHEDIHQICNEGGEGANLHAAGVDADGTHVVGGQGGHVHDKTHHRHQRHHQPLRPKADTEHFHVGLIIALFFIFRPDKGANDPDTGELFPHDLIQHVHLCLTTLEPGVGFPCDEQDCRCDDRNNKYQDQTEACILLDTHDDAANQHDRCGDDGSEQHLHHHLKLVDVVGGPGDQ